MWEDEAAENRRHERVGAAFEEAVDPELKPAVKSELGAEDFVLAENEEEDADADAEDCEGTGVGVIVRVIWDDGFGHGLGWSLD